MRVRGRFAARRPARAGGVGRARYALLAAVLATGLFAPAAQRLDRAAADAAPAVTLSVAALDFGSTQVDTTAAEQTVLLTNTGTMSLTLRDVSVTGVDGADFNETDTCAYTVITPTAGCAISVAFAPSQGGPRQAALSIIDNAGDSPQSVTLTGNGVAPSLSVAPAGLDFGALAVGATSAAQTVTIVNNGSVPVSISDVATSDPSFAQTSTCTAAPLPPSGSCTVAVTFAPASGVDYSGNLIVIDNALDSPQLVTLNGSGIAPPTATDTPTAPPTPTPTLTSTTGITAGIPLAGTPGIGTPGASATATIGAAMSPTAAPTATPSHRSTKPHKPKRPARRTGRKPRPASLALAVQAQGSLLSNHILSVHVRLVSAPRARVLALLQAVSVSAPATGQAHGHAAAARLSRTQRLGAATDAHGRLDRVFRIGYAATNLVRAYLSVTVWTARGTATRTIRVWIQPRQRRRFWFGVCVSGCG